MLDFDSLQFAKLVFERNLKVPKWNPMQYPKLDKNTPYRDEYRTYKYEAIDME
jgi:hypothetical protein